MKTYKKISKKKAKELIKKMIGHSAEVEERETEYVAQSGMCKFLIMKDAEKNDEHSPWQIFCWMDMYPYRMTYTTICDLHWEEIVTNQTGMICVDYETLELIDPATLKIE